MNALNSTNSCTFYLCPVQLGVGGAWGGLPRLRGN